jgi:2-dehydropantoate 2-reductase
MKILVYGAGAVGGFFGSRLFAAGYDVKLLGRGAHGEALRTAGLRIHTRDGKETTYAVPSVVDAQELTEAAYDFVLVGVKRGDLSEVAQDIDRVLAEDGLVVSLLNGLDAEHVLEASFGRERVVGGVLTLGSNRRGPGVLDVLFEGNTELFVLDPSQEARVDTLVNAFVQAGLRCRIGKNLAEARWRKLAWNAPFNGISALTRKTPDRCLEVPELEALTRRCIDEVLAVARAEGVNMGTYDVDKVFHFTRTELQGIVPSMLQDVLAGRPTEAEFLQGEVVNRGRQHGVDTPINESLLALITGLTSA